MYISRRPLVPSSDQACCFRSGGGGKRRGIVQHTGCSRSQAVEHSPPGNRTLSHDLRHPGDFMDPFLLSVFPSHRPRLFCPLVKKATVLRFVFVPLKKKNDLSCCVADLGNVFFYSSSALIQLMFPFAFCDAELNKDHFTMRLHPHRASCVGLHWCWSLITYIC